VRTSFEKKLLERNGVNVAGQAAFKFDTGVPAVVSSGTGKRGFLKAVTHTN
jgi:hypothetical protein